MPDVMTKYVTAEILRYLGAKIGLVTTTVVMALCADFADYWEAAVTDMTNNNSKPTIEHCKLSTEHCPKAPNAPRPYWGPTTAIYRDSTDELRFPCSRNCPLLSLPLSLLCHCNGNFL